jgi:hypothetical protein
MRENSGQSDAENNLRDPTLKEHDAEGGRKVPRPEPGDDARVGSDAGAASEDRSPDDRTRGETSRADKAAPLDIDRGS